MSNAKLPAPTCHNCGHEYKDHHVTGGYCRKWTSVVDWEWDYTRVFSEFKSQESAGAEATTKPDYLNKTLRECSREELMEALRVTEEKNKAIDAKSRISPEALDVRAGAEATGKSDPVEQLKTRVEGAIREVKRELLDWPVSTTGCYIRTGRLNALEWLLKEIDELSNKKA